MREGQIGRMFREQLRTSRGRGQCHASALDSYVVSWPGVYGREEGWEMWGPCLHFPQSRPPLNSDWGLPALSCRRSAAGVGRLGLGTALWGPGRLRASHRVGTAFPSPLECPCPCLALDGSHSSPQPLRQGCGEVQTEETPLELPLPSR